MKNTFIKIVLFVVGVLAFSPSGNFYAQATTPIVKRNSPFSPNPKKKVETAPKIPEEIKNTPPENPVRIENAKLTINDGNDAPPTENNQQSEPEKQNTEFESRSVAKKTLDIAKRNSSSVTAQPTEIYKVGAGDVLDIRILNSPAKESTLFTVLQNGAIDYPLAGEEPPQVAGLTAEEIENLLKEKVKLYENPSISVTVRDYSSHTISVLGLVEKPGTKALRREAIPLYVIMAEAIPHAAAGKATILRGVDKQTITVNLDDNETLIYPNDIIRVTGGKNSAGQTEFYYIGGNVASGGQKDFHDGITLTQAIMASGGLKKSSVRKVVIRRKDAQGKLVPLEYDLKFIKEGKIADPTLEVGDTIEIGN
ncbi:MAG TPA: polysaccharide biosynthesis/export family protein [Pyrinomonadaceae bacterium]|jgi:protein involved in polysaccharide export with SLBB domain